MRNSKEIFRVLQKRITLEETSAEIQSMVHIIMSKALGLSRADIMAEKLVEVSDSLQAYLDSIVTRVNAHEPIQYIVEEAYFLVVLFM